MEEGLGGTWIEAGGSGGGRGGAPQLYRAAASRDLQLTGSWLLGISCRYWIDNAIVVKAAGGKWCML